MCMVQKKMENNIAYEGTYLAPITSDIPFPFFFAFWLKQKYMFVANTHTHITFEVNLLLNLFLDASMVLIFFKNTLEYDMFNEEVEIVLF